MERFFKFFVTKLSLSHTLHSGLSHYALEDSSLRNDILLLIGFVPGCPVADVLRRVDSLYGPVPKRMKMQTISELSRSGLVSYADELGLRTKLQLTPSGSLSHTFICIARSKKASKESVAA